MSVVGRAVAEEIDLSRASIIDSPSSTNPLVLRLRETLSICAKTIEAGDHRKSAEAVSAVLDFIDSNHDALTANPEDEALKQNAVELLSELLRFISSPSLDQMVADALSFELPKVVAKFAGFSEKCCEIVECIISCLIATCSPRDMLSVLCEALDPPSEMFKEPAYFAPLLSGLSKVFHCIQRRQFEQIKAAIPVVLNVLKGVSQELDEEDSFKHLSGRVISIAMSIQEVCQKLEGNKKEDLRSLLGLLVLQIMAVISSGPSDRVLNYIPLVSQLTHFLPFCNLSYLGLITGSDLGKLTSIALGEDSDDYMSCFSLIKHGASLSVVWGYISDEVVKAAEEDFTVVKDILQDNQTKRWEALGMLKYVLSSIDQPWELKKQAINLWLSVTDGDTLRKCNYECADCSTYIPSLLSVVQAIEKVIVYAPDAVLRKNAFASLKRVLADIPPFQRFDILKASITNSNYPSMIAILLDLVRGEMLKENNQKGFPKNDEIDGVENKVSESSPFMSVNVLELVELVLKPPKGGPPSLPEQSDAVLSALNLYRFTLITESTGRTKYTGVLSEETLRKTYTEWLLPLRTLVNGITAEEENDYSQFSIDAICALNPVELVLYRCIELVEERLQYHS